MKPVEPEEVFKDVYNFEFLELKKDYKEEELKSALLDKVEDFLREFGPEFFVGRREVPVLIGGNYDRVDLELFHAGLLCYILVEIKIEKFKHSHVSQMYSYLNWYKENKLREGQRLPIGLIISKPRMRRLSIMPLVTSEKKFSWLNMSLTFLRRRKSRRSLINNITSLFYQGGGPLDFGNDL